jgi:CRP-like cAMP-binding protein
MLLTQAELFWGLNHDFVEQVMADTSKETKSEGDILFLKGENADYFYTLIKGRVKLSIGENDRMVFVVSHAGESFGWSSLVDRNEYSASAECMDTTTVIKINRERLEAICSKFPQDGYIFMKRVAGMLGRRLLKSYGMSLSLQHAAEATSHGTDQIVELVSPE